MVDRLFEAVVSETLQAIVTEGQLTGITAASAKCIDNKSCIFLSLHCAFVKSRFWFCKCFFLSQIPCCNTVRCNSQCACRMRLCISTKYS
jgi:hypothetical protein